MPSIILTSGDKELKCLFSKRDQDLIKQYTWHIHTQGYAVAFKNGQTIYMHRLVLNVLDRPEVEVDHKKHVDKKHLVLDNRRSQIRTCSRSQNRYNSRKMKSGSSPYKGVYREGRLFHSQIAVKGKTYNLGRYRTDIAAARAYDRAARSIAGDFAFLNFPKEILPIQLTFEL